MKPKGGLGGATTTQPATGLENNVDRKGRLRSKTQHSTAREGTFLPPDDRKRETDGSEANVSVPFFRICMPIATI